MAEFHTLGAIDFGGLDSPSAEALLSQPKRLSVLAYLLLAAPSRGQAREQLLSLFWPDAGPARARGSLRNALHFLRHHLGADAIRSRGEELVVNPAVLWCDAVAFETWITDRRYQEALDLYRGDLLPGLMVRESPGFNLWLEGERARLRQSAAEAAWAAAREEEQNGSRIAATEYARRAAALSGDLEQAVRRLMQFLDRVGDRVAALREYQSFVARWAQEYDLAPSAETEALAETIRVGATPHRTAVSPAGCAPWHGAQGERPPARIAVLPLLVTGRQDRHEYLATGLGHEIIAALSRLAGVRVVARTSSERFHKRGGRSLGRIAQRLGVDAVLDGALRPLGSRLAIVARLVDGRSETQVWAEVYEGGPSELLSIRTALVLDVLAALEIEVSSAEAEHLARAPTTDPEAYLHYLRGRSCWNRRSKLDLELAMGHFERALAKDPAFALAQAGLADAFLLLHPAAGVRVAEARMRVRAAAQAALEIDPRLGEVHATLGMVRLLVDRDWHGAEAEFRRAIQLSPGHATAHHWYGSYLSFVLHRFEEGATELELARQLDPLSPIIHTDIGLARLHRGRPHEAISSFHEALALEPEFWRAYYDLGIASVLSGDPERGVAHLRRAWQLGAMGANHSAGGAEASPTEDWREPLRGKLSELAQSSGHRGTRAFEAALVAMLLGDPDEALHWLHWVEVEGSWMLVAQYYPAFETLKDHPQFVGLLDGVGLGHLLAR